MIRDCIDTRSDLGKHLDELFDKCLRPLKSKNARKIFEIFEELGESVPLTSLDIQSKLDSLGIKLDKKEINGWLKSLLVAGLISKDARRGKPTTLKYQDKYTFDLWRITDLGAKVVKGLPKVLSHEPSILEEDPFKILRQITSVSERIRFVQRMKELYVLIRILNIIFDARRGLTEAELIEELKPSAKYLERILSAYSNQARPLLIPQRPSKRGVKNRILRIFRLSVDVEYVLNNEGRGIAQALFSEDELGQKTDPNC